MISITAIYSQKYRILTNKTTITQWGNSTGFVFNI